MIKSTGQPFSGAFFKIFTAYSEKMNK